MPLKCIASQFQISPSLFSIEVLKLYPVEISPFAAAVSVLGFVTRRRWRDNVRRGFLLLCAVTTPRPARESACNRSDSTLFRNLHRLVLTFTILQVFLIWQAALASELCSVHSGKFPHLWKAGILGAATCSPKGSEFKMEMGR